MLIELHVLQNFAPSNLNRDDTGAPKTCQFGGFMRARVSSQCWKRAARRYVDDRGLLTKEELGYRSYRLKSELSKCLRHAEDALFKIGDIPFSTEQASVVAEAAVRSYKAKMKNDLTSYPIFIGHNELKRVVELCHDLKHREMLERYALHVIAQEQKKAKSKKQPQPDETTNVEGVGDEEEEDGKKIKLPKDLKKPFEEFQEEVVKVLDLQSAADVAMFGRMLANLPENRIDAACQVAHPISTHAIGGGEEDYFTAVDDLQPGGETGAGHIGTTGFNSACYYRYTSVDTKQLTTNLKENQKLARRAAKAFLEAFVRAIPSGKKNSFSTQTRPSLVLAVVRQYGNCSLVDAFEKPVRPSERESIVEQSVKNLDEHFGWLKENFGEFNGDSTISVFSKYASSLENLTAFDVRKLGVDGTDNLDKLINRTIKAAFGNKGEGEEAR